MEVGIVRDGAKLIAGQVPRQIDVASLQQQELRRRLLDVADEDALRRWRNARVRVGVKDYVLVRLEGRELIWSVAG